MSIRQKKCMQWVEQHSVADIAGRLASRRRQVEQLTLSRNKAHDQLVELSRLRDEDRERADRMTRALAEIDEPLSMYSSSSSPGGRPDDDGWQCDACWATYRFSDIPKFRWPDDDCDPDPPLEFPHADDCAWIESRRWVDANPEVVA